MASMIEEKGLELNKNYYSSVSGRLKQAQIVIGAVYTGTMIHASSVYGRDDMVYHMFVACGCLLIVGTLISCIASELEWGPDGKIVMSKFSYVFNRFALLVLILNWLALTSLFLFRDIIGTDSYYYSWRWKWYSFIIATIIFTPINIYLYSHSMKLVTRSSKHY